MSGARRLAILAVAVLLAAGVAVVAISSGSEDAAADVPRSFFGVVPQAGLVPEDYERMDEGRVGTLRTIIPWGAMDPTATDDDTSFEGIDQVVLGAAEHGIEVLPFLYGTPVWVAGELDGETDCDPDCAIYAPRSAAALEAWAGFVGEVVERYGPEGELWEEHPEVEPAPVRAWQIWNEQNSPTFYRPNPDTNAYAQLLAAAEAAIHERDPGASVVLGGMFGTPLDGELPAFTAWDYLRRLYATDGARESFDSVAVHPYSAHMEKVTSQMELMHDEVVRAGDSDATIWVTEIGWASSGPEDPLNRGPEGQAEQLTEAFDYLLERRVDWNIAGVTWYAWRDYSGPGLCSWCPGSGLFEEAELVPKPSWDAFTTFTGGS